MKDGFYYFLFPIFVVSRDCFMPFTSIAEQRKTEKSALFQKRNRKGSNLPTLCFSKVIDCDSKQCRF